MSKWVFKSTLRNGLATTFNVNTGVPLTPFWSETVWVTSGTIQDILCGFCLFEGVVGENWLKIALDNGVVISGYIQGGPVVVQSIVGAGTWQPS
jgi:hypothetical protein